MTNLDELFAQPPAKWVLTTEQISVAAVAIGLTPTMEQVADLCGGHISAIMFHAAAKVGWFGPGIAIDGTAEDWQNDMGGSCDECEGVPRYRLMDLDQWHVPSNLLSWNDLRWAIHQRLTDEERADAAETFGPLPEVADLAWVKQFVEIAVESDEIETSCGLSIITLGEVAAYGAYTISGYSFTGLDIEFYGATHEEAAAVAWRINHLGIVQESDITAETLQLLDFAALRSDVLEHWEKQEAADAAGGNS
jgi:hypothetical protein